MKDKILVLAPLGNVSHGLFGHITHNYPSDVDFMLALDRLNRLEFMAPEPPRLQHEYPIVDNTNDLIVTQASNLLKMRDAINEVSISMKALFVDEFTKVEPLELGQFIVTDTQTCKPPSKGIPWNPRKSKKKK